VERDEARAAVHTTAAVTNPTRPQSFASPLLLRARARLWQLDPLVALAMLGAAEALSLGCSSSSGASAQPLTDAGADTVDGCSIPSDDPTATCIRTVTGKLTDVDGQPIAGKTISVCGTICFYAQSGADGTYTANINTNLATKSFAVLAHGRPEYASLYSKLPTGAGEHITMAPMRLAKYEGGTELPADGAPATSVTSGVLTIDVPDGTTFDVDVEDIELPTGRQLRVGKANVADLPDFAKPAGADALYGLGPFAASAIASSSASGPGAKGAKMAVHLKNEIGLAAGQKVEFFVLGVNLLSTPPSAGNALTVAKGTVSADGKLIETDAGEGISTLSWLGVRKVN
jgi:hypothetical protein